MNGAITSRFLPAILVASCAASLAATPPRAAGPFLGQRPPGDKPEIFAPGVVSDDGRFEHSHLLMAKDGRSLLWAAQPAGSRQGILEQSIWRVQQSGDVWSDPERLPIAFIGLASPVFSPDGKLFYFTATDDAPSADRRNNPRRVHAMSADFQDLTDVVPSPLLLMSTWSFSIADNGNVYFDKSSEGSDWHLYVMGRDGDRYAPARSLGEAVNSEASDVHPWITPDERTLIFASWRPGGSGGADLYASFRGGDGTWSPARNLGPVVNSEANERFPSLSPDGHYLFFTRNKGGEVSDYFWVGTAVLDRLRQPAVK